MKCNKISRQRGFRMLGHEIAVAYNQDWGVGGGG